ncbi:MAG TPA: hypothetical protein VFP68_19395, partial [Burkholderiaceae bacterium]|nr:hypothetical protein [Burkholderiaceae bacterium]
IRYVQLQPHPLLRSHQGDWLVTARPGGSGSIVYLNHTLQLDEQRVEQAKPEGATGIAWALMLVSQGAYRSLDALATAFDAARASLTSRRAAD